jgi:pantoate--beta-alanine ligase
LRISGCYGEGKREGRMDVISEISTIKAAIAKQKMMGKSIGFVPTMGFLHEGHLSLVRDSLQQADCSVVSIFVNPSQFGPSEDFRDYPRDLKKDTAVLEEMGVDYLFVPDNEEIYPEGFKTYVEVTDLQDRFEGRSRPGHFKGVCTVVLKLFMIVQPDIAFFGQKDAQQALIIKRMVRDLNLDVDIQVLPIIREKDGLAMSSRNVYLNKVQRKAALCLVKSLRNADQAFKAGERDSSIILSGMTRLINAEPLAKLDYVAIVDLDNLEPLDKIEKDALILVAVFIGRVRLIDNLIVRNKE